MTDGCEYILLLSLMPTSSMEAHWYYPLQLYAFLSISSSTSLMGFTPSWFPTHFLSTVSQGIIEDLSGKFQATMKEGRFQLGL